MAVAALITWVITAGLGVVMLGTWIARGGARNVDGTVSNFKPPIVFGHFLLAVAGLVIWIIFLLAGGDVLAWVAFALLVAVAIGGELLFLRWFRDRRSPASSAGAGAGAGVTTTLAEQRFSPPVVVGHGVFAVATVVLVLLTALGVGG